jgi:alkyl hydroperoxide reductase subunit AhpF
MIPLREQQFLRDLFRESLTGGVKIEFFTQRPAPVYIPGREECRSCPQVQQILEDVARLSPRISLRVHEIGASQDLARRYHVERVPAIVVRGVLNRPVLYYGVPWLLQFAPLIDMVISASRGESQLKPATKRKLKRLKRDLPVRVFVTPETPDGPAVVTTLAQMAAENGHIHLTVVDVDEFPALAQQAGVRETPTVVIDERVRLSGPLDEDALLTELLAAAESETFTRESAVLGKGTPVERAAGDIQRGEMRPSGLFIPRR